jgi:NADPH-dependent glutamate synthase beta subunit-like oxidoreductase/coenzyme F420-reducing hydrogenase delta subunit/ferredoxin
MSTSSTGRPVTALDLEHAVLRVPSLQAEPLTVREVQPSPCTLACPAGINVKSYVSLIAEGRFAEALEVVRERCPLPGVCGRVCHHPCEEACEREATGGPIAIRALKRFVADLELELPPPQVTLAVRRPERVAIVGSGPAGLTAAYDLARAGYRVTVFEAEAEPGGMLRYGIADYRLPAAVLDYEIDVLLRAGIEIRTGYKVGVDGDLEDLLADGYSAVLLAVGAQRGRRLGVPGEEDCAAVEDALAFLRRVNDGERTRLEGRVVVIGGGSTAIEAARSALRLQASAVEIVYRRQRGEMPADEEEIETALAEGVTFRFLAAPTRVVMEAGELTGVECLEVALGEPDDSGRRRPVPIPGSEFRVVADHVFAAVGQEADFGFLPGDFARRLADHGRLVTDSRSTMTRLRGVFAAGDVVTGPSTVIDAIAAGHRSATAIRRFLGGEDPAAEEHLADERRGAAAGQGALPELEIPSPAPPFAPRQRPLTTEIERGREFDEVDHAFSASEAMAEAQRCLRCGPCSECRICAASCGRRHITVHAGGVGAGSRSWLLRAPARIAVSLETAGPAHASVHPACLHREMAAELFGDADADADEQAVALLPTRVAIHEDYCRGCAKCIEVCAFDALSLVDPGAEETTVRLEAALCRGCNLCTAVCPTDAVVPTAVAPEWWGARVEDLYPPLAAALPEERRLVVLACQRRAGAVGASLAAEGLDAELVPLRCCGQVDAGMLLEVYRHGAGAVLVAGCPGDGCRYGKGADLAREQVERARVLLRNLGGDPGRFATDWSNGAVDRLAPRVLPFVGLAPAGVPTGTAQGGLTDA